MQKKFTKVSQTLRKFSMKILSPFGPKLAKIKVPKSILDKMVDGYTPKMYLDGVDATTISTNRYDMIEGEIQAGDKIAYDRNYTWDSGYSDIIDLSLNYYTRIPMSITGSPSFTFEGQIHNLYIAVDSRSNYDGGLNNLLTSKGIEFIGSIGPGSGNNALPLTLSSPHKKYFAIFIFFYKKINL